MDGGEGWVLYLDGDDGEGVSGLLALVYYAMRYNIIYHGENKRLLYNISRYIV